LRPGADQGGAGRRVVVRKRRDHEKIKCLGCREVRKVALVAFDDLFLLPSNLYGIQQLHVGPLPF
jgi:hypothetical protein